MNAFYNEEAFEQVIVSAFVVKGAIRKQQNLESHVDIGLALRVTRAQGQSAEGEGRWGGGVRR